jgi:hypothetical protein
MNERLQQLINEEKQFMYRIPYSTTKKRRNTVAVILYQTKLCTVTVHCIYSTLKTNAATNNLIFKHVPGGKITECRPLC